VIAATVVEDFGIEQGPPVTVPRLAGPGASLRACLKSRFWTSIAARLLAATKPLSKHARRKTDRG